MKTGTKQRFRNKCHATNCLICSNQCQSWKTFATNQQPMTNDSRIFLDVQLELFHCFCCLVHSTSTNCCRANSDLNANHRNHRTWICLRNPPKKTTTYTLQISIDSLSIYPYIPHRFPLSSGCPHRENPSPSRIHEDHLRSVGNLIVTNMTRH